MTYIDNIKWLESLKSQIGQSQHQDLWHFEEVIDETIKNLKPLAQPHGRLIDADVIEDRVAQWRDYLKFRDAQILCTVIDMIYKTPIVIEAEVSK